MKLTRLGRMGPAWLLDDRYELHLTYNHGRYFTITDRHTLVDKQTWDEKGKEIIIKAPQEHTYFDGGGQASQEFGLHNVKQPV